MPRRPALPPHQPVSRATAHRSGWSDDAIRHALRTGSWQRLHRGWYLPAYDGPSLVQIAVACQSSVPRSVVSHSAAAALHGLPVLGDPRPCLTVAPAGLVTAVADAHLHRATLRGRAGTRRGIPVTSPARTILDVARERGTEAGVVAADAGLRLQQTSLDELAEVLGECRRWPGVRRAEAVLADCSGAAESPLESLSRLRIHGAGLPRPHLQTRLGDLAGRFVGRADFYWPEFGVVGEADGTAKYDTRAVLIAEKLRQESLEQLGLIVVRWGWADLARFEQVAARLRAAFARGLQQAAGRGWAELG